MANTVNTMDWTSEWPAPAKLNLFLHVVGRRPDGYHLLQTVFRFIECADYLRFAPRADGEIVLATPTPGVAEEADLTVRAARLLQAHTGCRQGASITLRKHLPMGGGLGGGSSDAATVLLALNHLWQTGLPRSELERIGLALGADVPVFVHGRNCFAEGVGERFIDLELPAATYLILQPAAHVPTAAISVRRRCAGIRRRSIRLNGDRVSDITTWNPSPVRLSRRWRRPLTGCAVSRRRR